MKKILQVVSAWGSGGVERYITNFQKYMENDYQYVVLPLRPTKSKAIFTDEFNKYGGCVLDAPVNIGVTPIHRLKNRMLTVLKCVQETSCEIVHINGTTADILLYCWLIKRTFPGVKVVVHCHGDSVDPPHKGLKLFVHRMMKNIGLYKPDYCLGCSERAITWMFSPNILNNCPHKVVYCGIEADAFKFSIENRKKVRKELECPEGTLLIGTVGRMSSQKNPMFILDILNQLKINKIKYKFLWIGTGALEEAVKKRATNLNIEDNIIFYGVCNNTSHMYSAMDVFILPSLYEGNPIVGFEAQASGLPCFFSDNIVKEAQATDYVYFLPIENTADIWAKSIETCALNYHMDDAKKKIIEAGQDSKECAEKMMKIYKFVEESR